MDEITHPNTDPILRVCRQYAYTDDVASEIKTFISEDTDVSAYLRENKPYERDWDDLAARLKSPDVHTEKAFDSLTVQAQECLRLRVLNGYSIVEITEACTLPKNKVETVLKEARDTFWEVFVTAELDTLRMCRKFVYSDIGAIETAIAICSKDYDIYAPDALDTYVLTYLAMHKPYESGWDSVAVRLAASDAHTQKAFNALDSQAQECLRLRTLDGYSIREIAATCKLTEKKVQAALKAARNTFWEAFVASETETLRTCRKFIYSDADATETAVIVCSQNWGDLSSEASSVDVLTYLDADKLSSGNWDTLAVHLRGLDDEILDTEVQKAFDSLEESEIALLRLRVGNGHTITAMAEKLECTELEIETFLTACRTKFWRALIDADPVVLRECRRLIHDDTEAEEIAIAICMQGGPVENVRQHVYDYLVKRWDPAPDWDDPDFVKVVEAAINPSAEKGTGFGSARIAYNQLDYPEQDLLKYKVVEHLSDAEIAEVIMIHLEKVERDVAAAKSTFWTLFTRERWSTLSYFIEELCQESDSPSNKILKVEAEQFAAETAYELLDETEREILKSRFVHGLSVLEIAIQEDTSTVEIAEILKVCREEFYYEFLSNIYSLWTPKVSTGRIRTDKITVGKIRADEEDVSNAWEKLHEQYYKIVPENFRGWLSTSAKRSQLGTLKEESRHGRITEKRGGIHINDEGESVPLISITEKPLTSDEAFMKKEAEAQELASWEAERERWYELLNKTTTAILASNKPEKKLFLLINYFLQPKLNELKKVNGRDAPEFQHPGEAMAMAYVKNRHQLRVTQAWIGEPINETARTIRRYTAEITDLVKECAAEVGISSAELVAGCPWIKNRLL